MKVEIDFTTISIKATRRLEGYNSDRTYQEEINVTNISYADSKWTASYEERESSSNFFNRTYTGVGATIERALINLKAAIENSQHEVTDFPAPPPPAQPKKTKKKSKKKSK